MRGVDASHSQVTVDLRKVPGFVRESKNVDLQGAVTLPSAT